MKDPSINHTACKDQSSNKIKQKKKTATNSRHKKNQNNQGAKVALSPSTSSCCSPMSLTSLLPTRRNVKQRGYQPPRLPFRMHQLDNTERLNDKMRFNFLNLGLEFEKKVIQVMIAMFFYQVLDHGNKNMPN